MKTKHLTRNLTMIGLLALGAVAAGAQTANPPPANPPPPPPNGAVTSAASTYAEPNSLLATFDTPYAFRFHRFGASAEIGDLFMQQSFLGVEVSYWDAQPPGYDLYEDGGYIGRVHYHQDITTVNLAYRYYFPLAQFATAGRPSPVSVYLGASAGAGWVRDESWDFPPRFSYFDSDATRFSGELLGGLQFALARNVGLRVGYRYIYLSRIHHAFDNSDVDSGAVEAGLSFRF